MLLFDTRPIESLWLSQSLIELNLNPTFNFRKSVERLDGSWITFVTKNITDSPKVDFFNPSIIDFLNNRISDEIKKEIFEKSIFLGQLLMRYHSEIDLKTINEKNSILLFSLYCTIKFLESIIFLVRLKVFNIL